MPGTFGILMCIALLCFFAAAVGGIVWAPPDNRPFSIGWLGAFFACLALFVGK